MKIFLIKKKVFKNLNLLYPGNYLHSIYNYIAFIYYLYSIYIALGITSNLKMISRVREDV